MPPLANKHKLLEIRDVVHVCRSVIYDFSVAWGVRILVMLIHVNNIVRAIVCVFNFGDNYIGPWNRAMQRLHQHYRQDNISLKPTSIFY